MEKDIKKSLMKKPFLLGKIKSLPIFAGKRKIAILLVIIVLGFFGWQMFKGNKQQVQYQTARVERGTIISTVTASGTVSSVNNVPVTTSATGAINKIYVKNGDMVNQGDTIATLTLDSSSLQKQAAAWANYLLAQNSLNFAKAKLNSLQAALFAANQKFVKGAGTQNPITDDPTYIIQRADWLQAESDYNNQKGVIAQAEAALSNAWLSYSQTSSSIAAPMTGTVIDLSFALGAVILGSSSTSTSSQKIAAIKTDSTPTVSLNLSEIDVPKVKLGNKATLTFDAIPGKTFTGKIVGIDTLGVVSSGVTNYPTTLALETQTPEIFSNMSVSSNIITDTKSDVLKVLLSAIQTEGNQSFVRVLKKGLAQQVLVKTGISSDTQTEITSGLAKGDEVITGIISVQSGQQSTSPFGVRFGGVGGGGRSGR